MCELRSVIHHPLTDVVLYAARIDGRAVISRVLVGSAARSDIAAARGTGEVVKELARHAMLLRSYLDGNQVDFSEMELAPGKQTQFVSAVLEAARSVAFGATCSYSELARKAGYPGAVRAAASVMRNNRWPLLVPCHRIICKDGAIGAYNGDRAGEDALLKKKLLQMEQIHLKQLRDEI
jgi:methylated-DNA-[protein]-cysteine S-methyltransferase